MKKSMYSLILSEDVIRAVDRLAAENNTNRSNMINQILAEYLSLTTPEKHVQNIFDVIEKFIDKQDALLYSKLNGMTASIKSPLRYHYRPTIRYEVEMYRTPRQTIGQLKINFRTTSHELSAELTRFFKTWIQLENAYIRQYFEEGAITYTIENGRFLRSFAIPNDCNYADEEIGKAISNYIATFDKMLNDYLTGNFDDVEDIEKRYVYYLNNGALLI